MRLGGMICPSVPEAQITPQASPRSYPRRSMPGRVSRPSVTTVAPTMPVVAPISTPTRMMPMPSPPRKLPAASPMTSISSSASLDFSSITPMNTKSGMASSV